MTQGRKAYGPTMKTKRDLIHFKKMRKKSLKDKSIEGTLEGIFYKKPKKSRWH